VRKRTTKLVTMQGGRFLKANRKADRENIRIDVLRAKRGFKISELMFNVYLEANVYSRVNIE